MTRCSKWPGCQRRGPGTTPDSNDGRKHFELWAQSNVQK